MRNQEEQHDRPGDYNQRIGRELYEKDREQHTQRYGYRGRTDRKWDEGNFFHTGPSPRGAQDNPNRTQSSSYQSGHSSYPQHEGSYRQGHYGSRTDSPYRNENRYLNHGYRGQENIGQQPYRSSMGGSQPGNYNEPPTSQDSLWRESPQGRSRYKETDYRYGSGSHNWYREGRYSPDQEPESHDKRGFFQRVRDTWDDIMHADDPEYQNKLDYKRHADSLSSRQRYGSEAYRDRNFDQGYEGGPRWADETDSGRDNYYNDRDRDQRNRR